MVALLRHLALGLVLALAALVVSWIAASQERSSRPGAASVTTTAPAAQIEILELRDAAKVRVAAQVLAGELDLFGAATHFRRINHEPPELAQLSYQRLPGKTDEEKLCREVILWVKFRAPRHAPHAEVMAFVARLEDALASRNALEPASGDKRAGVGAAPTRPASS